MPGERASTTRGKNTGGARISRHVTYKQRHGTRAPLPTFGSLILSLSKDQ